MEDEGAHLNAHGDWGGERIPVVPRSSGSASSNSLKIPGAWTR